MFDSFRQIIGIRLQESEEQLRETEKTLEEREKEIAFLRAKIEQLEREKSDNE